MSEIDPIVFGRLQAQVETLIASDGAKTALLAQLASDMTAVRLQLAEAKGGWRLLMLLGGAGATFGSVITWGLTHFKWSGA
jgi:hypothetical protein